MAISLRPERLLAVIGALVLAAGWAAYSIAGWQRIGPPHSTTYLLNNLATGIGTTALAVGAWTWFKWIERSPSTLSGLSSVLTFFAVGNALLSIGLAINAWTFGHHSFVWHSGRWNLALVLSLMFQFIGMLFVTIAFWSGASKVRRIGMPPSNLLATW